MYLRHSNMCVCQSPGWETEPQKQGEEVTETCLPRDELVAADPFADLDVVPVHLLDLVVLRTAVCTGGVSVSGLGLGRLEARGGVGLRGGRGRNGRT